MNYIKKNSTIFLSALLLVICFVLYFINMGEYPLIDTTETKYVSIARDMLNSNDWINLKLNGENYFENPPLLFWLINISFLIFGKISTFAARVPIFVLCSICILSLFLTISKILTKSYALIISLIMATSFGFIVFGRLATADILYTASASCTILLSYFIILNKPKIPTFVIWAVIYLFSSFSILTGGFLGIIPLIIILAMHIFSGKLKEFFKPINLLPGLFLMCLLTLPWFIIMVNEYGNTYLNEFLNTYNIFRYFHLKNLVQVCWLIILSFLPWLFAFLWIIGTKFKDIINSVLSYFKDNSQEKLKEKWKKLNKVDKFLSLNTITFFTTLIFAILYGSKFIYLILFLTLPASCIAGHYWYEYMFRKEHAKSIFFATMIPNLLFIICSFIGLFGHNYINKLTVYGFNFLIIPLIIIFFVIPLIAIFSIILKGRIPAFVSNLILMISLSFVLTPGIFNFITINSGENDLIGFARTANIDKVKLATYTSSKKYSLVFYYDDKIDFHKNNETEWLRNYLKDNKDDYIITEIKDLWAIESANIKYMLLDSGIRYCLIKHLPRILEEEMEQQKEPEITIRN